MSFLMWDIDTEESIQTMPEMTAQGVARLLALRKHFTAEEYYYLRILYQGLV